VKVSPYEAALKSPDSSNSAKAGKNLIKEGALRMRNLTLARYGRVKLQAQSRKNRQAQPYSSGSWCR
jgi:hypothetical protein